MRALGPAMAIVVMVSMLVSVTLVPALIALLGRRLYWPGLHESRFGLGQRLRGWVTRMLTKRWVAVR